MASDDGHRAVRSKPSFVHTLSYLVSCSDRIAALIRKDLGVSEVQLTLAQILESATWKGGREIAKMKRPETGGPPVDIESDGTVF